MTWIAIALLGAAGAFARYRLSAAVTVRWPSRFPLGTFTVNVSGAFALGVLSGADVTGEVLLAVSAGFLGSFTTFSTWMVEAHRLGEDADWPRMSAYLAGSLVAGVAAAGSGWILAGIVS